MCHEKMTGLGGTNGTSPESMEDEGDKALSEGKTVIF